MKKIRALWSDSTRKGVPLPIAEKCDQNRANFYRIHVRYSMWMCRVLILFHNHPQCNMKRKFHDKQ